MAYVLIGVPPDVSDDRLRAAVSSLVHRHPALRTEVIDGEFPRARVVGDEPARLAILVLTEGEREDSRSATEPASAAGLARAAELARVDPPMTAVVVRRGSGERQLLLPLTRVLVDRWSLRVIAEDLAELCAELGAPTVVDWAPVEHDSDADVAYWSGQLDGIPSALTLPGRASVPARGRSLVRRPASAAAVEAVRKLAGDRGRPVRDVAFAALAVVLARMSGQKALTVGLTLDGRTDPASHPVVGRLSATVPLPVDLREDPAFADLLDAVGTSVARAEAHQHVPLGRLAAVVAPQRDPLAHPLFQVSFEFEDTALRRTSSGRVPLPLLAAEMGPAVTDLHMLVEDGAGGMTLTIDYATDVYPVSTIETVLMCWTELVEAAAAAPEPAVSRLRILPDEERRRLAIEWNMTAGAYDTGVSLHGLFERQVERDPDRVAVTHPTGTVTYAELNAAANRLAHLLIAKGVGVETHVGVCMHHGVDVLVAFLAILKAGGAYVPLDPTHPGERMGVVLADAKADMVLTTAEVAGLLPASVTAVAVDEVDTTDRPDSNPDVPLDPDNLVYTIFTSGSSGRPKGVQISHRGLNNYLLWAIEGYGATAGEHGAPLVGSIAFDLSIPNIFLPLVAGRDVMVLPRGRGLRPLVELVRNGRDISLLKITPAHLDLLRAQLAADETMTSVHTYVVGADEMKPDTAAQWRRIAPHARILNEYGPTETVVGCSIYEIPDGGTIDATVPIGRPIGNMTMYVLDEHLEPVPVGVIGELYIGGVGVARGYAGRPGITAEKFLPDPFSSRPGARFYRSGDYARMRPDGELDFLGRIDHQVKIRGYRIELGEVEANLLTHPAVEEAVVAVREDKPGDRYLAAYLVTAGRPLGRTELRRYLAERLPDYLVPRAYVTLDRMPLSQGGKVDRRLLPDPARRSEDADAGAPDGAAEKVLARAWCDVLGIETVARTDRFYDRGGHSLAAWRVVHRVAREGLTVDPRLIVQWQTIADVVAHMDGE